MKKIIFLIALLMMTTHASAQTLRLKSGQILEGTLVPRTDAYVKIESGEIIFKVIPQEKPAVKKDEEDEFEYTFQEIPINEGVTIPAYNFRWDNTDITFNLDNIPTKLEVQDGQQKVFNAAGSLKASCEVKNGVLNGTCRTFAQNGAPILIANYKDGQFDSLLKVFYPNGKLFYESLGKGKAKEYYDNGQVKLDRTTSYAKTYWKDGTLRRETGYQGLSNKRIRGQYVDYDRQGNILTRYSRITHTYDEYMRLGREQEKQGNWTEALRDYQQAYHVDPTAAGVNMAIGTLYFKTGSIPAAIKFFEKTTHMAPNHITSRIAAGVATRMMKQYDRAIKFFQDAQRLDPNSDLPLLEIGRTFYAWGKPKEAGIYFKKALDLNPNSMEAYEGLKMIELQSQ